MSEFTAITTQEEFDSRIGDRLKRSEEKWQKKFEGYLSPEEVESKTSALEKQLIDATNALDAASKKVANHEKELSERDSKIKGYEINSMRLRIAHESGLSFDAVDFIQGDDEETIRASVDKFKSVVGKTSPSPSFSNEPDVSNSKDVSIKKLAQSITPKL